MQILPQGAPHGKDLQVVVIGNSRIVATTFVRGREPSVEALETSEASPQCPVLTRLGLDAKLPTVVISTVPATLNIILSQLPGAHVMRETHSSMPIAYNPPSALGMDRLANALAAKANCGAPVLVVDCGTATTFTLVDASGTLVGGAIMLGLGPSRDGLARHTAQLPTVPIELPVEVVGRGTVAAMQSGLVLGHVGAIESLAARMAGRIPLVLTGGWGPLLHPLLPGALLDRNLTAEGGRIYWEWRKRGRRRT